VPIGFCGEAGDLSTDHFYQVIRAPKQFRMLPRWRADRRDHGAIAVSTGHAEPMGNNPGISHELRHIAQRVSVYASLNQ
jgi:hypothetical protein